MNAEKTKAASVLALVLILVLAVISITGFSGCTTQETKNEDIVSSLLSQVRDTEIPKIDYLMLVNERHPLPDGWDDYLILDTIEDIDGNDVQIERATREAYISLETQLAQEGVHIAIAAARPIPASPEKKPDPTSEYTTGLAIDLCLVIDGVPVRSPEALSSHPDIWDKVHSLLPNCEFVVRYPEGKDDITGHPYQPWRIRYVYDGVAAQQMLMTGESLEEFLGVAEEERAAVAKAAVEAEATCLAEEATAEVAAAEQTSYSYSDAGYDDAGASATYSDGIYHAEYNSLYNDDGPSRSMPGWHDGYLETYYNASGHYLADTWTLDDEGFYHDENGRYVVGVDISHKDDMPYGTVVDTGKGEGVVYDYGAGAEVHDFATNW